MNRRRLTMQMTTNALHPKDRSLNLIFLGISDHPLPHHADKMRMMSAVSGTTKGRIRPGDRSLRVTGWIGARWRASIIHPRMMMVKRRHIMIIPGKGNMYLVGASSIIDIQMIIRRNKTKMIGSKTIVQRVRRRPRERSLNLMTGGSPDGSGCGDSTMDRVMPGRTLI
jgi:hypothetical protein